MIKSSVFSIIKCSVIIGLTALLGACDKHPEQITGFVLPTGDVARGKAAFSSIGCRYCHTIKGEDFPPFEHDPVLQIELGGEVYKVKNYGELLTSIVNPNHIVSPKYRVTLDSGVHAEAKSPMPEFNDVMTVAQLIDLTEFLHSRFELRQPEYRGYSYVR